MTPETYVDFILDTNASFFGYSSDAEFERSLPTSAFGLAEEVFEVLASTSDESRAKEVGDCAAYFCLVAAALGYPREKIVVLLESTTRQSNTTNTTADYLGTAKRYFRGDATADALLTQAFFLLLFVLSYSGFQLEPVLTLNYNKLTARLENTGTFHGSGDR